MGTLQAWRERRITAQVAKDAQAVTAAMASGTVADPSTFPISSPWATSELQRIVYEDIFGRDVPLNTRSSALRIPPFKRARDLMVATISRFPLRAYDAGQALIATQPAWLYRTDQPTSPRLRMVWTVDDLIFYGRSLWWRENDPVTGFPVRVGRVNYGDWTINADSRIEINGIVQLDSDVILFAGFTGGVLADAKDALDDTRMLYRNVRARLLNPSPSLNLQQTGGDALTDDQIDALVARWAKARQGENGGVGFSSTNIKPEEMGGSDDAKLMIESRNAAALDMARVIGVHGSLVDATTPTASLNYETTTGRNQEFVDFDLAQYTGPIEARLSLDDVVPAGVHVAFDLSDFTAAAPSVSGPDLQD